MKEYEIITGYGHFYVVEKLDGVSKVIGDWTSIERAQNHMREMIDKAFREWKAELDEAVNEVVEILNENPDMRAIMAEVTDSFLKAL